MLNPQLLEVFSLMLLRYKYANSCNSVTTLCTLKFMNLILVEEDCCIPVQQSDSQGQSLALVIDSLRHALC